jgi:hypothetical protein
MSDENSEENEENQGIEKIHISPATRDRADSAKAYIESI